VQLPGPSGNKFFSLVKKMLFGVDHMTNQW
jgi:hypothetical protein